MSSHSPTLGKSATVRKKILVTLSTGKQGKHVVQSLAERNRDEIRFEILAVTRSASTEKAKRIASLPGVYLVESDYVPSQIFEHARKIGSDQRIYGVFSVQQSFDNPRGIAGEIKQGKAMIDEAVKAGVSHFIYSSGDCALHTDKGVPHFDSKIEIEKYLKAHEGLSATILQPAFLLENFEFQSSLWVKLVNTVMLAGMRNPLPVVSASDIGEFTALVIEQPGKYIGLSLPLAGDFKSGSEIQETIQKITGVDIPVFHKIVGHFLLLFKQDIRTTFEVLSDPTKKPDFTSLRVLHPGLKSLEDWILSTRS